MSINSVSENSFSFLNKANNTSTSNQDDGALATEDFLALMTTQLQNQDPLKPLESGDFLGQIASFSTVSGIGELNDSFEGFAQSMQSDQALRGSALVGRSVLVPSSLGNLTAGESITGQINVADPVPDLKVQIFKNPLGYSNWLHLMTNFTQPYYEVAVVGENAPTITKKLYKNYLPNILISASNKDSELPLLEFKYINGKTLIYVCVDGTCKLPLADISRAIKSIKPN